MSLSPCTRVLLGFCTFLACVSASHASDYVTGGLPADSAGVVAALPPADEQQTDSVGTIAAGAAPTPSTREEQAGEGEEEFPRVPAADFTYAGVPRYTMNGSLPYVDTHLKPLPAAIVGGVYIGAFVWLHNEQANAWWADQRGEFHIQDDWEYALQVDKAGHFYGGYMASYLISEGLLTTGMSWDAATVWGSVAGLMYQTYVELEDGYARDWGFSPSDMVSNTLGAGYFVAQHYVPFLQNFTPKWQYVPSDWLGKNTINHSTTFIDDYNGSTFWMSANVHNLLPEAAAGYWPRWLNIAVGYNVYGVGLPDPRDRERRYVVALDYNLVELLPDGHGLWNWFRQGLNMIKLPAPAIVIGNTTRFHLLYPFTLSTSVHF